MPLDPNILLQLKPVDFGGVTRDFYKEVDDTQQRKKNSALSSLAIETQKFSLNEKKKEAEAKDLAKDALEVKGLLDIGDVEGAKKYIQRNTQKQYDRLTQDPSVTDADRDTFLETQNEFIKILDLDPEKGKELMGQSVNNFAQRGLITLPKGKPGIGVLDDKDIPVIINDQGQLLSPSTGRQIEGAMLKEKSSGGGAPPYSVVKQVTYVDKNGVSKSVPISYDTRNKTATLLTIEGLPPGTEVTIPQFDTTVREGVSRATSKGKEIGKSQGTAIAGLPGSEASAKITKELLGDIRTHPGMKDVIGLPDNPFVAKGYAPGSDAANFRSRLKQFEGRTFTEVFPTLKGGGPITDVEGEKAQSAMNRMIDTNQSEKSWLDAVDDFEREVQILLEVQRKKASGEGEPSKKEKDWSGFKILNTEANK